MPDHSPDPSVCLRRQVFSLTQLEESLKKAYRAVTEGKFGDGLTRFTALLHTIPLLVVDTRKEVDDVKELISIAKCARADRFGLPRNGLMTAFGTCPWSVMAWKHIPAEGACDDQTSCDGACVYKHIRQPAVGLLLAMRCTAQPCSIC